MAKKPSKPEKIEMVGPCGRTVVLKSDEARMTSRGYTRASDGTKTAERTQSGPRQVPRAISEEG